MAVISCKSSEKQAQPEPEPNNTHETLSSKNEAPAALSSPLLNPAAATETAPETFDVKLETTQGDMIIEVHRAWSPKGADRFYNLVKLGYYNDIAFFRVISGFMAQVGIHGTPEVNTAWRSARIEDDPVVESNKPGFVSYAMAGPNTRTTQFFINFSDNSRLDGMGFSPFGKLKDGGLEVLNKLHAGYGEGAPGGNGPAQGRIHSEGNTYLKAEFPRLDYIKTATIM